jgi:uncharacterized membrane protein YozB (DUF420 family)
MYQALLHAHSGLRWVALILLIAAIFTAVSAKRKGEYTAKHKKLNLFAMVFLHTQALIGFIMYFQSPKVQFTAGWMKEAMYRFYGMEHLLLMLIAVVLVTIGRKKAEKALAPIVKHQKIVVFYSIALLLILASIPWPFRSALGGAWF